MENHFMSMVLNSPWNGNIFFNGFVNSLLSTVFGNPNMSNQSIILKLLGRTIAINCRPKVVSYVTPSKNMINSFFVITRKGHSQ